MNAVTIHKIIVGADLKPNSKPRLVIEFNIADENKENEEYPNWELNIIMAMGETLVIDQEIHISFVLVS